MPALETRAIDEAFDAFDACGTGAITSADARVLVAALGVDATQQVITDAFAAVETDDAVGRKTIAKADFADVVAKLAPAAFSDDDNFAAFSALDVASASRVPASALEGAATAPVFLAEEGVAAGKSVTRYAAYPAKGMSLVEWRDMLKSVAVAPAAAEGDDTSAKAPAKKATKM